MALLSRWRSLRAPARRSAIAVLLGLAGCAIFGSLPAEKPQGLAFSHKLHVEGQGLGCADCHAKWNMAEEPGMPSLAQCMLCHAQIDAPKPPEKQVKQLFDGTAFKAHHFAALPDETRFTHQQHAGRDPECASCHGVLAESERPLPAQRLSMEDCEKCHAQRNAPNECSTCHTLYRSDVAPPNHDSHWKHDHGRVLRAHNENVRVERCDTCHSESSCVQCHKAEAPENHTNYWRRRGHGLSASMDRRSCAACHEPESCEACHSSTKPMNHTGSWGAPQDRHCLTCHEPLRVEANCQVCHKSTPSHALATPMPSWHLPGMNCRQCHGNGQPLPHADNGSSCIECHH